MDEELRGDQERERAEKPSVRVKIQEKGNFYPAQSVTVDNRKQPERSPGN